MWIWNKGLEDLSMRVRKLEMAVGDHLNPPEEMVWVVCFRSGEKMEVPKYGGSVDMRGDGYCYITIWTGRDSTTRIYPKSDILSISKTWRKI